MVIGVSGARRNPAAAVAMAGRLEAFCEQERLTRHRGSWLRPGELPQEAVNAVLKLVGGDSDRVAAYVTAEEHLSIPSGLPLVRLDHHRCHAATAFLTSPFDRAAILVCDQNVGAQCTVWLGEDHQVVHVPWPSSGQSPAAVFTRCAQIFGYSAGQEHRLEALARRYRGEQRSKLSGLFRYIDGSLHARPEWEGQIWSWLHKEGPSWTLQHGTRVAGAFQAALGDALLAMISDIRRSLGVTRLCLGGGFFYNTFFNTLLAQSGSFEDVFVPPNPGNAGIAAGAALAASPKTSSGPREIVSAFLGPEYENEQIKQVLDNCKLPYDFLPEGQVIDTCVEALMAGRLVGWFQGRMEWGIRALGNRSILANPFSPYVLDNLNVFLKNRERHHGYALSVSEAEQSRWFQGPARSGWMEYDYRVTDQDRFRHVLPLGDSALRLQTVGASTPLFQRLHDAFGTASGAGVLVNTSFNGFSEPIVCSPRDAIRVFYGTGLDLLAIGRFVIRK
jgi:carbamoyltransferase